MKRKAWRAIITNLLLLAAGDLILLWTCPLRLLPVVLSFQLGSIVVGWSCGGWKTLIDVEMEVDTLDRLSERQGKAEEVIIDCMETLRYNLARYDRKDEPMMLAAYNKAAEFLGEKTI